TRAYGRSPSAEVAKMVEEELGHQRRREAREQNSYGLDQVRDGISISRDKVNEPIVDYDQIMKMPNLRFYVRLPGEYPVVKLSLKYRKQKKYHPALMERDFRDRLSPELERIIESNERSARAADISFPTGDELLEGDDRASAPAPVKPAAVSPSAAPAKADAPATKPEAAAVQEARPSVAPDLPAVPVTAAPDVTAPPASASVSETPPASNVRPFPLRAVPAPVNKAAAEPPPATPPVTEAPAETAANPPVPVTASAPSETTPAAVRPVMKPRPAGPSALDMLARRKSRAATSESGEGNADEAAPQEGAAQGEAPELHMQMEKDDGGRLTVRHISPRKTEQQREEERAAHHGDANARMADDEKNILRHRDDYAAYQEMSESLDPGGYER
ncbi:type IV secretion system DNA-binding domain-containing protein, partial [Pantoea dispersa]|uniref:type IV secretion system DNA-binding domain-containing protein n=1 Tax=Pantoea dispersa TaxID=59814 RepID=UPI0039BE39C9